MEVKNYVFRVFMILLSLVIILTVHRFAVSDDFNQGVWDSVNTPLVERVKLQTGDLGRDRTIAINKVWEELE
jgi:hypothetical protein